MVSEDVENKGFTLVELAVVITIIGLLTAGTISLQSLIQTSRISATVAQVKGYEAAVVSFREVYKAKPGDLIDAHTRIPNCPAIFCDLNASSAVGDFKVGLDNWDILTFQGAGFGGSTPTNLVHAETVLFWYHLMQTGLLAGVTDEALYETNPTFGGSFPAAKIRGGFWAGHISDPDNGGAQIMASIGRNSMHTMFYTKNLPALNTVFILVSKPNPGWTTGNSPIDENKQPLFPVEAYRIDKKIDDGHPFTGRVHSYGGDDSNYLDSAKGACTDQTVYLEGNVSKDCGLIFGIEG